MKEKQVLNLDLENLLRQSKLGQELPLMFEHQTTISAIFSLKAISRCSHNSRWNRLYLAGIGDATYSSSGTEESVAFRLYRLEEGGQDLNSPPLTWSAPIGKRGRRWTGEREEKMNKNDAMKIINRIQKTKKIISAFPFLNWNMCQCLQNYWIQT